jgi:ribonuclease M5
MSITWEEYSSIEWNKSKRKIIANYFKISESNNKQLFKRLNMMNVTLNTVKKIIFSYKDQ